MGLSILLRSLSSRVLRSEIAQRTISLVSSDQSQSGISVLIGKIANLVGFVCSQVLSRLSEVFQFSFSAIWGLVVGAVQFVWTFNWNITTEQLEAQTKQLWEQVAGSLGATLGNAVGWLTCGILPGATMLAFNEALGLYVLAKVGEEALEELVANLSNLILTTFNSLARVSASYLLVKIRDTFYPNANRSTEPWSFASALENKVENINNTIVQRFIEEFIDEAGQSCIEAGYVVANSLDSFFAQQAINNNNLLGPQKTVQVTINRK